MGEDQGEIDFMETLDTFGEGQGKGEYVVASVFALWFPLSAFLFLIIVKAFPALPSVMAGSDHLPE